MTIEKILVASDFSAEADQAVEQAACLARQRGAQLVLLHVEPIAEPWPAGVIVSASALSHLRPTPDERQARARDQLARLATRLAARGTQVEARVTVGRPDEAIVATANELEINLVVVGTRGRTGLARTLLGSVASHVVRCAERPVLVVRHPGGEDRTFQQVLVATDFSPASEAALELSAALAGETAAIELFHVRQVPDSTPEEVERELEAACGATGQQWIQRHGRPRQTLRFTQEAGSPARCILERLERDDGRYDLLALGGHGLHGFRRLVLGGVAERALRHAPCSTLIAVRQS